MSDIRFRIAAKTDVGLERDNNEDNFQVSANLDEAPMKWVNNQEYSLGNKGALLVVADGMGGMNAGEVASEIAINTVREMFSPEQITDEVVKTRYTIEKFMKGVIVEADKRIKDFAKQNPDSQGMGTTIVIAWLFDGHLYVSWCGDSRAYIYNPNTGLFQISKDHSYVQVLVDTGKLSREEAFDFPDSNIVTRSLTDSAVKAAPDCLLKPQPLCDGDIIILCSDGLNGMIRDQEIESVIAQHQDNMTECVDTLIQAALDAAGADNCTVALCQILSGGEQSDESRIPKYSVQVAPDGSLHEPVRKSRTWLSVLLVVILFCILGGITGWYFFRQGTFSALFPKEQKSVIVNTDSIEQVKRDSLEREKEKADSIAKAKTDSVRKAREDSLNLFGKISEKVGKLRKDSQVESAGQTVEETLGMTPIPSESKIESDTTNTKNKKNKRKK